MILDENSIKEEVEKSGHIIAVTGPNGIGKSTFSTFLAQNVEKKVLLIDFDLEEKQIKTLLKIKKQFQYSENLSNLIITIDKNLDVLCDLDIIIDKTSKINYLKVQEILNTFKNKYDFIIIDTSSDINQEYTKRIFYNSNKIIFLIEPNILGIKKAKKMLEIFENDLKIDNYEVEIKKFLENK